MSRPAGRSASADAGALLFWCASLAVGLAAFVALAALGHHEPPGGLADASAVLSTSFVTAVVPGAIQLRAAAAAADGRATPAGLPVPLVAVMSAALLAASPLIALALTVPALSILLLAVQFPVACVVGVQRGTAIGLVEHGRASASMAADAACRLVAGVGLGLLFGANGLAAALLLGTVAAAAAGRRWYPALPGAAPAAPAAIVSPALTVGLMMLLVNLDVLAAPRVLGAVAADAYAVAELPAKGVFFALFAVSWLAVPAAARSVRRAELLTPVAAVFGLGVVAAGALLVLRPLLPIVLGEPTPAAGLLAVLTLAMSASAALATALAMAVARGAARPWLPTLLSAALLAAVIAVVHPGATDLGVFVLIAQSAALAGTVGALLRTVAPAVPMVAGVSSLPVR